MYETFVVVACSNICMVFCFEPHRNVVTRHALFSAKKS